ncbi:MAG TPA: hypothetical protein VGM06_10050 [Polyangiaceae bacterium]|jgi:hypothetical protein
MDRHARQARLAEVGAAGQARIARAVVDVGASGLAADVAVRYLAGAGAGRVNVRDAALGDVARGIDPGVRVEVEASIPEASTASFDLRDPVAKAFAAGAVLALRALRGAITGEDAAGAVPGGRS